jgi:hypothetical protein
MGEPGDFEGMSVEVSVTASEKRPARRAVGTTSPDSDPRLSDLQGTR